MGRFLLKSINQQVTLPNFHKPIKNQLKYLKWYNYIGK